MKYILIGGAWPYANGPLHIGHIAGLLNGDILARYHRLKGNAVLYVSGSDCHGTPITLKAKATGQTPKGIAEANHRLIASAFEALDFSYDEYGLTTEPEHYDNAQNFFRALDANGYVFEKETLQHYCNNCERFLADRYIIATCPNCGAQARGEECDTCNAPIDTSKLLKANCAICEAETELRLNHNLYLRLSAFQEVVDQLNKQSADQWRANAVSLTERYTKEGLLDRAYSRDLEWGIPVPKQGYENKTLYIWTENVLGYSTQVRKWCKKHSENPEHWLKASDDLTSYYVHAKDNIPFHTIILPSLLYGANPDYAQPDYIVSNEYLTLEGQKISTSSGWAIWVDDLLKRYQKDSIRHYLTIQAPEKKDSNFTFKDFIYTHNSDLVGQLGNLVNRTLAFISKYFEGHIEVAKDDTYEFPNLSRTFELVGRGINDGHIKDSYQEIFNLVREANVVFDREQPWLTRASDVGACQITLLRITGYILNIATLLLPFLPSTSKQIFDLCQVEPVSEWLPYTPPASLAIKAELSLLFERIPVEQIENERQRLTDKNSESSL